jgi:hypothetical protein
VRIDRDNLFIRKCLIPFLTTVMRDEDLASISSHDDSLVISRSGSGSLKVVVFGKLGALELVELVRDFTRCWLLGGVLARSLDGLVFYDTVLLVARVAWD